MSEPFLSWGITVIEAAATVLEAEIPDARRGNRSSLSNYEALYVRFREANVEQSLAIWMYATREGAAYKVGTRADIIGAGLKHKFQRRTRPGCLEVSAPRAVHVAEARGRPLGGLSLALQRHRPCR